MNRHFKVLFTYYIFTRNNSQITYILDALKVKNNNDKTKR